MASSLQVSRRWKRIGVILGVRMDVCEDVVLACAAIYFLDDRSIHPSGYLYEIGNRARIELVPSSSRLGGRNPQASVQYTCFENNAT